MLVIDENMIRLQNIVTVLAMVLQSLTSFKSVAIWLFVQQLAWAHNKENIQALEWLAICDWNPPVTGGFTSQRTSNAESISMPQCYCILICPWK